MRISTLIATLAVAIAVSGCAAKLKPKQGQGTPPQGRSGDLTQPHQPGTVTPGTKNPAPMGNQNNIGPLEGTWVSECQFYPDDSDEYGLMFIQETIEVKGENFYSVTTINPGKDEGCYNTEEVQSDPTRYFVFQGVFTIRTDFDPVLSPQGIKKIDWVGSSATSYDVFKLEGNVAYFGESKTQEALRPTTVRKDIPYTRKN